MGNWIDGLMSNSDIRLIGDMEFVAKTNFHKLTRSVSGCVNVYQSGQFENAAFFGHETCHALTL